MVKIPEKKGLLEYELSAQGKFIAGVDEVGRGCIAGPVVTAAVILDYKKLALLDSETLSLIRDSKALSHKQRVKIIPILNEILIDQSVGRASEREIEEIGILPATFLAMHRAIAGLQTPLDLLLIDGNQKLPNYIGTQQTIVKGDSLCFCIAAASIIAKEDRDHYMQEQGSIYPQYGFESHVGYGTQKHMNAMKEFGICNLHRKNFAPVRDVWLANSSNQTTIT